MRVDPDTAEFVLANMRDDYIDLIAHVRAAGRAVSPRGLPTRELRNVSFRLDNPYDAWAVGIGRGFNVAIAAAEAAQLVGGVSYPELMKAVQPRFEQFMDGGELHGAYGPRVRNCLPEVEKRLRADSDTRQAQITIWSNEHDLFGSYRDLPCTTALRFYVRDGKLELDTTMRSNDCVWGLSHDIPMFTQLQLTMANVLGIEPGPYRHHASSLHFYERDEELFKRLHKSGLRDVRELGFVPLGFTGATIEEAAQSARRVLTPGLVDDLATDTEGWYRDKLAKFL